MNEEERVLLDELTPIERAAELVEYLDAVGDTCFVIGGRRLYTDDLRSLLAYADLERTRATLQEVNTVSEAVTDEMNDAGWKVLQSVLDDAPELWPVRKDSVDRIYLAMRAAAPTAPVQDDDAAWLRDYATQIGGTRLQFEHRDRLERIATRLSADHTGVLVEALAQARSYIVPGSRGNDVRDAIDRALAARGDQSPDVDGGER